MTIVLTDFKSHLLTKLNPIKSHFTHW